MCEATINIMRMTELWSIMETGLILEWKKALEWHWKYENPDKQLPKKSY